MYAFVNAHNWTKPAVVNTVYRLDDAQKIGCVGCFRNSRLRRRVVLLIAQ